MDTFSIDLLKTLISVNAFPVKLEEPSQDEEQLELSLGLSMNGRFGVDPRAKKIERTSSVPVIMNPVKDEDTAYVIPMALACTPIIRTCSLPTETEEQWRRRKELETHRRLQARKKRSEKQRNKKAVRGRNRRLPMEIGGEDDKRGEGVEGSKATPTSNGFTSSGTTSLSTGGYGLGSNGEKGTGSSSSDFSALPPPLMSQGANGSRRTRSLKISAEEKKSLGANSLSVGKLKYLVTSGTSMAEESGDQVVLDEIRNKIFLNTVFEGMPPVTAKGEGPNGKRVEGLLYRYGRGEEAVLLCVCHGAFFTPAEFVKHAGGGDVPQPLKHIVVNPKLGPNERLREPMMSAI